MIPRLYQNLCDPKEPWMGTPEILLANYVDLTSTVRHANKTPTGQLGKGDLRPNIKHTPERPPRPAIPSEISPRGVLMTWQRQAMETPRVGISVRDREHMMLVGESARQRRKNHVLSDLHSYQDIRVDVDDLKADRGGSSSEHGRHRPFQASVSRQHRDGTLTNTPHTPRRPAVGTPDYVRADAGKPIRRGDGTDRHFNEAGGDLLSYTSSEYSDEGTDRAQDRHDRHRSTRRVNIVTSSDKGEECKQRNAGKVSELPDVDLPRLYKMETARRGVCVDCRRAGKEHTIIRGRHSLICSSCRQNHDCSSWEEVNNSSHKLLMAPLRCPPPRIASSLRSPPGTMKPPPPLKERAFAAVTPLLIAPRDQRLRMGGLDQEEDHHSPITPIAVTKALPLPRGFPSRNTERAELETKTGQASTEELRRTLIDINPVRYLRRELSERGVASKVGPLPATDAVQELSTLSKGEILRTVVESANDEPQCNEGWELGILAMYEGEDMDKPVHDGLPDVDSARPMPPPLPPITAITWI
ncbi:hypothetical protein BR93DRAFT_509287 [Coniochaeta sp. PMI_546]|nr:hypothetical protein BR93DRAFT_509287 [Coniochaeta sp. PMI_546]